jgi:hypothetical protein
LLLYLKLDGSGPEQSMYLTRHFTDGLTGFEPATSSSRSTVGESSRSGSERELSP